MGDTLITAGSWQNNCDGSFELVVKAPLHSRIHLPCEDGRIFTAAQTHPKPWGGVMRVSCVGLQVDEKTYQLSIRSTQKNFLEVNAAATDEVIELTFTYRYASYSDCDPSEPPPQLLLQEHKDLTEVWQDYRAWIDRIWPERPYYSPPWTQQIPAVVLLELWTGRGTITHTFDDMASLLQSMHEAGVPKDTLLYFWGFHAPFDTAYPRYWPADELGGERGLDHVVQTAKRLGYRLMPHLNYWGCDSRLALFEKFKTHQVRDRSGKLQGWRVEGEPPIEYIRPSSTAWREHMANTCQAFVERFPVDALFLDQLGLFFDDPDCDFDLATQQYIDCIQDACPNVVLGGEIFHERCRSLPLWQVWGTPWCGLPVREDLEHAVMWRELFGDHHTLLPHMGMPGAVEMRDSWPAYYWYINHYGHTEATQRANQWHKRIGALPSVRVNYREFGLDPVATEILTGAEIHAQEKLEAVSR